MSKRQEWKVNELVDELQVWTTYLQVSADRFNAVLQAAGRGKELEEILGQLKKDATALKTKSRKLRTALPRT